MIAADPPGRWHVDGPGSSSLCRTVVGGAPVGREHLVRRTVDYVPITGCGPRADSYMWRCVLTWIAPVRSSARRRPLPADVPATSSTPFRG